MLDQHFVILGALIASIGSVSYLINTLKGKVKPNRVSFLLWSLAPLVAFVAEVQQGVGIQSLMTFTVGFFPLTIFVASFVNKKSEWRLHAFDLACGAFSLVGLILWYITKSGNVAILLSIVADGFAALPTAVKAFKYPETENALPYFTSMISATFTLLTIKIWNFPNIGFPIYIEGVSLVIFSLVQFKPGKLFFHR